MANSFQKLQELDLSREEVERIGEALKKEEFRKLLVDYVEEVQNPTNKKLYQEEIVQLERERGIEATFINPIPGYVIKSSVDGLKKCFINICSNEHIGRPSWISVQKDGTQGVQWSLPHSLAPSREDTDNKGVRCIVYDVVFHPETLLKAVKNKTFYNMINNTACEGIEANFQVTIDKKNLKFPKLSYKGQAHPAVIRKPIKDYKAEVFHPEEQVFLDKIYAQQQTETKPRKKIYKKVSEDKSAYTIPTYTIKHRSHVDIQDFVDDKHARLNTSIPKELVIEVNLPLLKSSSDITLDVTEKTVQLSSEKPSKYKLNLTLSYRVNQDNGNAKFDKELKKLIITLPVKKSHIDYTKDDSGVESDQGLSSSPSITENKEGKSPSSDSVLKTNFLDENCHYELPDFTSCLFDETLAFTLNVKNVEESSICKVVSDNSLYIKFTSTSSSYYQAHYALYVKFLENVQSVQAEAWDNNVIVHIQLNCNTPDRFYYGLNENNLTEKFIKESSPLNNNVSEDTNEVQHPIFEEVETRSEEGEDVPSNPINISGTSYESSGDELSYSYSPSKSKGILKRLSKRNVGRSISESSLDDYVCSSFDNESAIPEYPEDGEMSTSLKKTVRFSDVIMRQLYR